MTAPEFAHELTDGVEEYRAAAGLPLGFHLTAEDLLTDAERADLERLRHTAQHYGGNMMQSALDRLNWLEVASQRDALWAARTDQAERIAQAILAEGVRLAAQHHEASEAHGRIVTMAAGFAAVARGTS